MDALEKHLQRKIQENNRASTKTKVLVFLRFYSCPCFVDGKLRKKIISLLFGLLRYTFNRLVADRLAQLVEHRTAVREVAGSNRDRTNTQGL